MKNSFYLLILGAALFRLVLISDTNKDGLKLNPDEDRNWQIASNHINGHGYSVVDSSGEYKLTAFHGSFPVFLYEWLIQNNISKTTWAFIIHTLSIILFVISIYFFVRLARMFMSDVTASIAGVVYSVYPSFVYYIGSLFLYENIVTPLLVIVMYWLCRSIRTFSGLKTFHFIVIPMIVSISCLLRGHMILVYGCLFTGFITVAIKNFRVNPVKLTYKDLLLGLCTLIAAVFVHIPIWNKNNKMFGEYMLSTQVGYEFFQGHNPMARGSWNGQMLCDTASEVYKTAMNIIPGSEGMNEFQLGKAREDYALSWITHNPTKELALIIRKAMIYFFPSNYEVIPNGINVITGFIHLGFLLCIIFLITGILLYTNGHSILLQPIIASVGMSLIFFAGYRWRMYAEPSMILLTFVFIDSFISKEQKR